MPIFIPAFLILFVVIPYFLTKMAADLLGVRRRASWLALFMVIAALNWELWQAPRDPARPAVAVAGYSPTR
jgi:hypothetical protein